MCWPRLKCWRIARDTRKVAIMQPIQDLLLLTDTRVSLSILAILPSSVSQRSFRAVSVSLVVIRLFPAASDEQHISNLDVAALSCWSDVDTLVFATLVELFPGDRVVVIRVIVDAFLVRVAAIVEEYAASRNAVLCPMMNRALVVS